MIKERFDHHYRGLCETEDLYQEAKAWALLEEIREEIDYLMDLATYGSLPKKLLFLLRKELEGVF